MENPELIQNTVEKKSEKEIADYLLKQYPDKIKSIETFDPASDLIDGTNLPEIEQIFKESIRDEDESKLALHCVKFLHSPIIEDVFGNDRQSRIDFINKVTDNGRDENIQQFFTSNRLKLANIRGVVEIVKLLDMFEKKLPEELFEESESIKNEIDPSKDNGGYSEMSQEEKIDTIKKIEKLSKEIISHYLEKYALEKAA